MEENTNQVKSNKSMLRRILKWVFRFVLLVVFLLFLINLKPVQSFIAKKLAKSLSERLDAEVTLDHLSISIIDGLVLEDFNVVSASDTVLACKELDISLRKSLLNLFSGKLFINKIKLNGSSINIVKNSGDDFTNFEMLLQKLGSDKQQKSNKSIVLELSAIEIEDVHATVKMEDKGIEYDFLLFEAYLGFDQIELESGRFLLDFIQLNKPIININRFCEDFTEQEGVEEDLPIDTISSDLFISITNAIIKEGKFSYSNQLIEKSKIGGFDSNHFVIGNINFDGDSLVYDKLDSIRLSLNEFAFKEENGRNLKKFSISRFYLTEQKLQLEDVSLITDDSEIFQSIQLKYPSKEHLFSFDNSVVFDGNFDNSRLDVKDLLYFLPKLKDKPFFVKNKNLSLDWSGHILGKPNNFIGNDISIKIGNRLSLDGTMSIKNIQDMDNALVNFNIKNLNSSVQLLRDIIPNFNAPPNFDKLGKFNFQGKFNGFIKDFVAYGKLNSDIGQAEMDMRLDLKHGTNNASYSGEMSLVNFDLQKWTDNPNFGKINFYTQVSEGKGLTGANAEADLTARVNSLELKGYAYEDFVIDGKIKNNNFDGSFTIHDPNLDVVFNGQVDLTQKTPFFNFNSKINNLDLTALNLSKTPLRFNGDFDINMLASSIDDLTGTIAGNDINVFRNDTIYNIKELKINSRDLTNGQKSLNVKSDFTEINIEGIYKISNFGNSLKKLFEVNYAYPAELLKIHAKEIEEPEAYSFSLDVTDSRNLFELLNVKDMRLQNFKAKGSLDTENNELDFAVNGPLVQVKDLKFMDVQILANSKGQRGDILINLDSTYAFNRGFNPIEIQAKLKKDTASILLSTFQIQDSIQRFDILTEVIPHEKGFEVHLKDEGIRIFGRKWKLNPDNKIIIGKNYHQIEHFVLTDANRFVELYGIDDNGIGLKLREFDIDLVNGLIHYDKMKFTGIGNLNIRVENIYKKPEIYGQFIIPDFKINGDSYGDLEIDVTKQDGGYLDGLFSLIKDDQYIKADGKYNTDQKTLVSTVKGNKFPLKILEYLLKDGISETQGTIDLDAEIDGPIKSLQMSGGGIVKGGAVKVNYLGSKFYFDNQRVKLSENKIDLTGAKIYDENGQEGIVKGWLYHDAFRNFGVDANISGKDVLILNTTKFDNPIYYGKGKGDVSVDFKGSFDQVDMTISAVTKAGTEISIPIKETRYGAEESFIKFVTEQDLENPDQEFNLKDFVIKGLSVKMDLTLTPDAKINLIFDEATGDIISGTGQGDLNININRFGDFEIFGEYTIEQGRYLFTIKNFAINKEFTVRRGSKVVWTGDPINARLDIKADYTARTSLTNFISESLLTEQLQNAARASQEVNLILLLGGTLYSPDIQFNMEFPELTGGELKSIVDNKVNLIKDSPNELNSQVMAILMWNTFIPYTDLSSNIASGSFLQSTGISTLSEFVSNQLSIFLTGFINEALEDNKLISSMDFDISMRNNVDPFGISGANSSLAPSEIEVRLKNRFRFWDERLELQLGGNYVRESILPVQNYFAPDFAIQYFLTSDRKLKLRLYGKYDYDLIETNARNQKYGLGLGYSTEFGSLYHLKQFVKNATSEQENKS